MRETFSALNRGQVRKGYLNFMTKVHPDQGGSNFLAKQLNEARDILLGF